MFKRYLGITFLVFSILFVTACTSSGNILLPWETGESGGQVSNADEDPIIIQEDDPSLPYWVYGNKMIEEGGQLIADGPTILYISEESRQQKIKDAQVGFDLLKQAAWNTEDPDVLTNGNIATLLETLSQIPNDETPRATYAEMKVPLLCENIADYVGEKLWWTTTITEKIDYISEGSEEANAINDGKPFAIITAYTPHKENIYLYVMDCDLVDSFFSVDRRSAVYGYPVGTTDDGIVLCVDTLLGG